MTSDEELIAELWREVQPSQVELLHELVADAVRVQADLGDQEAWTRIRATAHRLAGTLGSFGQQPAGTTALTLDRTIVGVEEPDEELVGRAALLIGALHDDLTHDCDGRET